jgi:hypothetical protein
MRPFALIEGDRATMLHVRHDGDVTVFDRSREGPIRFRIAESTATRRGGCCRA